MLQGSQIDSEEQLCVARQKFMMVAATRIGLLYMLAADGLDVTLRAPWDGEQARILAFQIWNERDICKLKRVHKQSTMRIEGDACIGLPSRCEEIAFNNAH